MRARDGRWVFYLVFLFFYQLLFDRDSRQFFFQHTTVSTQLIAHRLLELMELKRKWGDKAKVERLGWKSRDISIPTEFLRISAYDLYFSL